MGKYTHLKGTIPKFVKEQEGAHREKVELLKKTIVGPASNLSWRYEQVRMKMARIKEQKSECQVEVDAYEEMLIAQYEAEEITSLKMESGASVCVDVIPYPQMKDKEKFRLWCHCHGLEKEMHLHPGTTASLVALLCLTGKAMPTGIDASMKDTVVFTKAK
jgi:hypothetical protein